MKRTDMMRKERELRQARKKELRVASHEDKKDSMSVGAYIDRLYSLFFHDETRIYNTKHSVEILELLEEMKKALPVEECDTIIRKAIRKSKVSEKDLAFRDLKELMGT